ncbi:lipase [Aeromicrobium sp.]|uniref:esterase/lipase family protein n=1 Tax=Aeromicrobium sp. TaxID=1871063 RepID=UPI0030C12BBD
MKKALSCSGPLSGLTKDPVLLTPAFSSGPESYGFGYLPQLKADGVTTCVLTLPDDGYGDLQTAAEYNVHAIRWMAAESGRKVALLGHQHGALNGLWALRFWPDLPDKVSEFVALATPFGGTAGAAQLCNVVRRCPASYWQIATGSRYLAALLAKPLPAGPSYTSIATAYDEVITPQPKASMLPGARNITLQSICPGRPIEHFSILADNLTYLLVRDALGHPGPADAARISKSVCTGSLYMPAASKAGVGALNGLLGFGTRLLVNAPRSVAQEPATRTYAVG